MELVDGRTLRALIDEGISLDELARLGGQMAKALGAAPAAAGAYLVAYHVSADSTRPYPKAACSC